MKSELKLLAAAVALASSAGANAAMDNFATGSSSLAFIALDSVGSPISMMMDLDFNVDDFLPSNKSAAGTKIEWNFNNNTLMVNGVASTSTQTNWSSTLTDFYAVAQSTETKWGVIAGDSLSTSGSTTPIRYLSTSEQPLSTLQNQSKANLASFSVVDGLYNANNLLQAASGLNGSTATAGAAYVGATNSFNVNGNWQNKTTGWDAYALEGNSQAFFDLEGVNGISSTKALVMQYGAGNPTGAATFHYNAGVLTYSVPAPVPLPQTAGLMTAALGLLGVMARRRANKAG